MEDFLIMRLANGFMSTYVLYISCELKIFDQLEKQRKNIVQLSGILNINSDSLLRILRPLVSYGIISRDCNENYYLEKFGERLVSSNENSLWKYVLFCGREGMKKWKMLYPAMMEKNNLFSEKEDFNIFTGQKDNKEKFQVFDGMMETSSRNVNLENFLKEYMDKDRAVHIADVGGGTGTILFKFLKYYTKSIGTILDLHFVEEKAKKNILKNGLEKRCFFKQSDFFCNLNIKAEVFVLSRVLHDWEDRKALLILENISKCMSYNSDLIIIEEIMPETNEKGALEVYLNDLQMWAFCNGRERTEKEFNHLLEVVGLELNKSIYIQRGGYLAILIAKKRKMIEGFI